MSAAPHLSAEPSTQAGKPGRRLDQCTPGFVDAIGNRYLTFDPAAAASLEILHFGQEFSESPAFEKALRRRVDQVIHLQHPSISVVLGVERQDDGLLLISKHASGRRLSELLTKSSGPLVALDCLRQLAPELATLAQAGDGVGHGALTLDRIVSSHGGRLVLTEHVLGPALETMNWPVYRVRDELGLPAPNRAQQILFDAKYDVVQLGFIALCLLLGRKLDPADYPSRIAPLLDEAAAAEDGDTWAASRLRSWIERALQVGPRPLTSARDAANALNELPKDDDFQRVESRRTSPMPVTTSMPVPSPAPVATSAPVAMAKPIVMAAPVATPAPVVTPNEIVTPAVVVNMPTPVDRRPQEIVPKPIEPPKIVVARPVEVVTVATPVIVELPKTNIVPAIASEEPTSALATLEFPSEADIKPRRKKVSRWVVGFAALAAVQGGVIVGLLYFRSQTPPAQPQSTPAQSTSEPAPLPPAPATSVTAPLPTVAQVPGKPTTAPDGTAIGTAGLAAVAPEVKAAERFGGFTITAPIELQVYENGKLIGSTAGPIAIMEGAHTIEVVNETLGFRATQTVNVKPGQLASRTIAIPNGRISINAVPWADVWIDGNSAGQTPLANLALPIGQHEIVFRNPQFAEQKQTATVTADGLTRVSATMKQ